MVDKRAHLHVSGRVQGVFFRAFTEEIAKALKLGGWSCNLPDGRVEVIYEGPMDAVTKAIAFIKQGTPASKVENVEVTWEATKGEGDTFTIKYF